MKPIPRRLFALDHNFPKPIANAFAPFLPFIELVSVVDIGKELIEYEDWDLLEALQKHECHWDGLITSDHSMLKEPRTLAALRRTRLTLVVAEGHGDNHIRASGLVLFHIEHICRNTDPSRPQVWHLTADRRPPKTPDVLLNTIAQHRHTTVADLLAAVEAEIAAEVAAEGTNASAGEE